LSTRRSRGGQTLCARVVALEVRDQIQSGSRSTVQTAWCFAVTLALVISHFAVRGAPASDPNERNHLQSVRTRHADIINRSASPPVSLMTNIDGCNRPWIVVGNSRDQPRCSRGSERAATYATKQLDPAVVPAREIGASLYQFVKSHRTSLRCMCCSCCLADESRSKESLISLTRRATTALGKAR
jgi:hypothetical protein